MRLSELIELYALHHPNLRSGSRDQLRYTVNRFGDRSVIELNELTLLRWISVRRSQVAVATVARDQGNLLTLWRFAAKRGLLPPPPEMERIEVPVKIPQAWTLDEVGRLLDVVREQTGWLERKRGPRSMWPIRLSDWWASLLSFVYDTGSRISAALSVRPHDLNLQTRRCILRAETSKTGLEQCVGFSEETGRWIGRHLDERRAFVWPWPWARRKLWLDLRALVCQAGIPLAGFHQMRRTTATQLVIAAGWEQARVALGHSSERMTKRYVDLRQVSRGELPIPRPPLRAR